MSTDTATRVPILTAARMKACDAHTIRDLGIPSRTLMERAARAVVNALVRHADRLPGATVTVLCGRGNNGGDGFAVARLVAAGEGNTPTLTRTARVIYIGPWTSGIDGKAMPDKEKMSPECAAQYELARAAGVMICAPTDEASIPVDPAAGCIVDALFGIGLDRPLDHATTAFVDRLRVSGQPVLAVDIPSGIHADTGSVLGTTLPAAVTVTMQALKPGLVLYPGAEFVGLLEVADIGVSLEDPRIEPPAEEMPKRLDADTASVRESTAAPRKITPHLNGYLADDGLLLAALPPRSRRTHKGTYGQVALLCGSSGMSGAATLAARAALRSGVGLCRVVTPTENRVVLQITVPEAIVTTYTPDALVRACPSPSASADEKAFHINRKAIRDAVSAADGLVMGCGLGTTAAASIALYVALESIPVDKCPPIVLDADALNLLVADPTLWDTAALTAPERRVVITPHPAEMARLTGLSVPSILADPLAAARDLAARRGVTVVLKDAHTVIAAPNGRFCVCRAGNAGMATGGSGDVLAGILGSLLTQRRHALADVEAFAETVAAGVYLHAAAGDAAAATVGEYALVAGDIAEGITAVTAPLSDTRSPSCRVY